MGVSLFVGSGPDWEFRLSNAYWYNEFLNYCAERGDCENLLYFTLGESVALSEHKGDRQDEVFSLDELTREAIRIMEDGEAPDYATHIAEVFLRAINACKEEGLELYIN